MSEDGGLWADVVPRVDAERCRRCLDCPPVRACLAGALRREEHDGVPRPDPDACFGCYSCIGACPHGALILPKSG